MSRAARVYDFTLTGFGTFNLLAEGSFYRIMSATGAVDVRRDNGSLVGPLLAGQGERAEFKALTITDKSGVANSGTILVADDNFIDDRVIGEVAVINGGMVRSVANQSFLGATTLGGAGGLYSHVQLWNPLASGKNAFVTRANFSTSTATAVFEMRSGNIALATLSTNPQSKKIGAAASAMELRTEQNAAVIGSAVLLERINLLNNTMAILGYSEPIMLEPGQGILIVPVAVNLAVFAGFEYIEVTR